VAIVETISSEDFGLVIDEVGEVISLDPDMFEKTPATLNRVWRDVSEGVLKQQAWLHGHETMLPAWPGLSGSWGGVLRQLDEHGITVGAAYIGEFVRRFSGGAPASAKAIADRLIYQDNLDLSITVESGRGGHAVYLRVAQSRLRSDRGDDR